MMEDTRFANRLQGMAGNVIRELLKLTRQPDFISFAGGMPSPEAFPNEILAELARELLLTKKVAMLQYGESEGYYPLRQWIASWVSKKGIEATPEEVIILSGSQQGIDLSGKMMLNPGDRVAVEAPTYLAAINIYKMYEAEFVTAPNDPVGLDIEALETVIVKEKPKLLYLVPTFQNPTGRTLPIERRQALAQLLTRHEIVLVEDDPYSELSYEGEPVPAVMGMDTTGQAMYLGSFSKLIAPGLRVGFAVARSDIFRKLVLGKQTTDTHASLLAQALVHEFCSRGYLEEHLKRIRAMYDAQRLKMKEVIELYMPKNIQWSQPEGGMFFWGVLPEGVDAKKLMAEAIQEKRVAFIAGDSFFADGTGQNTLRLNFSNSSVEQIEKGIKALAEVFKKYM
ncbi:MAG: PLP-dependent aminotransferase family protein [Firmicutes bacterium]|nr:PLP-dependent aminotransferase family protein [Bacillota bacterium]